MQWERIETEERGEVRRETATRVEKADGRGEEAGGGKGTTVLQAGDIYDDTLMLRLHVVPPTYFHPALVFFTFIPYQFPLPSLLFCPAYSSSIIQH